MAMIHIFWYLKQKVTKVSVTDTEGDNTIQLPEWSKIKSVVVAKNAIQITCDNMTVFTINGADKFKYDIGGNKTGNEKGSIKSFEEFVSLFDLNLPQSGTNSKSVSKIVFKDEINQLYEVKVTKKMMEINFILMVRLRLA